MGTAFTRLDNMSTPYRLSSICLGAYLRDTSYFTEGDDEISGVPVFAVIRHPSHNPPRLVHSGSVTATIPPSLEAQSSFASTQSQK